MSKPVLGKLKYLKSGWDSAALGECMAEIAFLGRSNVGKSSLLNALCGEALANVSSTPGRTRAINVFAAEGGRWLVDLPGYGYAEGDQKQRGAWGPMIEAYLVARPSLRMLFVLVDGKVGPTKLDRELVRWLQERGLPWRPVATKTDQVKSSQASARRRDIATDLGVLPEALAWVCSRDGSGIRELRAEAALLLA